MGEDPLECMGQPLTYWLTTALKLRAGLVYGRVQPDTRADLVKRFNGWINDNIAEDDR
jgi:hypothetical protein